jgi:hypothetical protein
MPAARAFAPHDVERCARRAWIREHGDKDVRYIPACDTIAQRKRQGGLRHQQGMTTTGAVEQKSGAVRMIVTTPARRAEASQAA